MKKRIALFANGWVTDNLINYLKGLESSLPDDFVDIFSFISYEAYGQPEVQRKGHNTIFKLPDLSTFDAAIVFYPGLNFAESIDYIYSSLKKAQIPVISICYSEEGFYNLMVDNYAGMLEMCNHLCEKHNSKKYLFIGGNADNADSNERLRALCDSMAARNLGEPDIFYSNWENGAAKNYIENTFKTRDSLPDAIVCANDLLATYTVLGLETNGFKVPDDIIVTGFDHQLKWQIFSPAIASVDQNYDKLGSLTAETLVNIFVNNKAPYNATIPCTFFPSETCGCSENCVAEELRRQYTHNFPNYDNRAFQMSIKMFNVENTILYSDNYDSLKQGIYALLTRDPSDQTSFYFTIDSQFADIGKDIQYPAYTFSETLDIIVAKHKTNISSAKKVSTKDIIPDYRDVPGNQIYLITSYYLLDFVCGYLAFANRLDLLEDHVFYDIANRINRVLISLKHNLQLNELNQKLSELMEQDTLTRVKNRAAYEKYLRKLERDFIEGENPDFAVVYFDINNLKTVNDMYGHEKGDAYIRNSCRLICNTFKHSPVFRIGGDEFVSIILNDDYTNRHALLSEMKDYMATLKAKGEAVPLTERISIASGMAEYDRTLDKDFVSIFKRADELMYENKYKMKKDI